MKKKLINTIKKIHLRIFGHEISYQMKGFLVNLSWSFFGGGIASLAMLGINIFAGRIMGPLEYGKLNFVLVISQFIILVVIFGLDTAAIKKIVKSEDRKKESKDMTSALAFVLTASTIILFLFFLFWRIPFRGIPYDKFLLFNAALIAVILALKNITDTFIRAIHLFKLQFIARIAEVIVSCIIFSLLFWVFKINNYSLYIYSLVAGSITLSIIYLTKLPISMKKFDWISLKSQLSIGKLFFANMVLATIFSSLDRVVIAKYMNLYELGIYGAYYTASVNLASQSVQMFNNVFFPTIAKFDDYTFVKKLDRILLLSFLPILFSLIIIITLILKLFGSKYGLSFHYIIGFAILSLLQMILSTYNSVIATLSPFFYKKSILYTNCINFLLIGSYGLLILLNKVSISYILFSLIISTFVNLLIQRTIISLMNNSPKKKVI